MTATLAPTAVGQIAINAKDVARATAFYRDVLGLRLLFEVPPEMAFFDCGGVRLMVSRPSEAQFDHPGSIVYYKVDDIQTAFDQMRAKGAAFEDEPHLIAKMPDHELWMVFFRDPEGNLSALMSEVR